MECGSLLPHSITLSAHMKQLVLLSLLACALSLEAQQTIGQVTLFGEEQPKVEAATKTEIPISKAPAPVTVITAKQIGESGARSVPDILRLVAGVNVRWNPMIQTLDIRGFGENPFSNRILLLIDGVPYNSGDTGGFPLSPGFDTFPIQNIKRIEIVRGPGSSLYGENAYWGVINIVTLSGDDLAGGDAQIFGGDRSTSSVNVQYGRKLKDGSILGSVRTLRSMFPMTFWIDDDSKFRATDIFLKGGYKDFQLSVYRHDDRLGGFEEHFAVSPRFPPGSQFASVHQVQQTLDIAQLKYNHAPGGAAVTYSADVSWSHRTGTLCAGCHAATQKPEFSQPANHGYQVIGDFRLGLHMIRGHDILFGAEGRRLNRAEHAAELAPNAAAVNGYDKFAIYAQDQFDVITNKLRAVAGLRYDGKTQLFDAKTSPRLSLVYTPNNRMVIRSGYSTAFRFPNFNELYQASWFLNVASETGSFTPFPLTTFLPNETLKPEGIRTLDLGGEYQISPSVSAKADLYRSKVSNFIVVGLARRPAPLPSALQFQNNPGTAVITGGELELRSSFSNTVTGFVNWAHQSERQDRAGVDATGAPIEFVYAPDDKVNLGAYAGPFHNVRGSLEASWRGRYAAPRFWSSFAGAPAGTEAILPGYTFLNGRLSYDFPVQHHSVRLSVFGNNLLDKRPKETLIGVDTTLVGREVYGQVEVRF